jgi:hypothetical protein
MNKKNTIRKSVDFADGWDWSNITWTDKSKRLQFGYDDENFTGIMYWYEPDIGWIVVLSEDVTNDAGKKIYGILKESDTFKTYQDAFEYVVELTEEYP